MKKPPLFRRTLFLISVFNESNLAVFFINAFLFSHEGVSLLHSPSSALSLPPHVPLF